MDGRQRMLDDAGEWYDLFGPDRFRELADRIEHEPPPNVLDGFRLDAEQVLALRLAVWRYAARRGPGARLRSDHAVTLAALACAIEDGFAIDDGGERVCLFMAGPVQLAVIVEALRECAAALRQPFEARRDAMLRVAAAGAP